MDKEIYRVEWSIEVEALDEQDAVAQCLRHLQELVNYNSGATVFFVSDPYGNNKVQIDAANFKEIDIDNNEAVMRAFDGE